MDEKKTCADQTAEKAEVIKKEPKEQEHSSSEHERCADCSNPNCQCQLDKQKTENFITLVFLKIKMA